MSGSIWTGIPSPAASRSRNAGVMYMFCSPSYVTSCLAAKGRTALTSVGKRTIAVTVTANDGPSGRPLDTSFATRPAPAICEYEYA